MKSVNLLPHDLTSDRTMLSLLSSTVLHPRIHCTEGSFLVYLWSDFGWSVLLDTEDPSDVRPEILHIKRGTPTHSQTSERKLRIRDGLGFTRAYPRSYAIDRGVMYRPRSSGTTGLRSDFWSIQTEEFEHSIYFKIRPHEEWKRRMNLEKHAIQDWEESALAIGGYMISSGRRLL